MSHTHFVCPDPFMWEEGEDGQLDNRVPIDACLNCSLTRHDRACPWDYADLTLRIEREQSKSYTPSKFLGCDEEVFLKINNDYAVDPALSHRKASGTVVHSRQEIEHPDVISEQLIGRTLMVDGEPKLVTVKADKIYRKMRVIQDDKTWNYLPVEKGVPKPIDPQYFPLEQLSIGAWAIEAPEQIPPKEGREPIPVPEPVSVERGQVIFRDSRKQLRQDLELMPAEQLEPWMAHRIQALDKVYEGVEPFGEDWAQINTTFCHTCPVNSLCPVEKPKPKRKPKK